MKNNEKRWTLRIFYWDTDHNEIAPTRRKSCIEGLLYHVESPKIRDLVPDKPLVTVNLYADKYIYVTYR